MEESLKQNFNAELQCFFDHFMKTSGNLASLRKLFGIAHANNLNVIPDEVIIALESTLCDKSLPFSISEFCAVILQEVLPCSGASYEDLAQEIDERTLNGALLLLALQDEKSNHKANFCKVLIENLTSKKSSTTMKLKALTLLTQLVASNDITFKEEDLDQIANTINIYLGPLLASALTVKKKEKLTEMDGSPATEMYTLLTLPENITDDYQLNIHAFSVCNQIWTALFSQSKRSNAIAQLEDAMVSYCIRIIEQSSKIPHRIEDSAFQQVALIEAISLLDKLCSTNCLSINLTNIKEVAENLFKTYTAIEVVIPVLQLFIHCDSSQNVLSKLELFFSESVTKAVHNLCSAGEVILFLRQNIEYLNYISPSPLRKWFPNILKIVAWYPITFSDDMEELISSFMDEDTSVEVFNSILNLPTTTVALIYTLEPSVMSKTQAAAINKKELQSALRKSFPASETYDNLFQALKSVHNHPRVIATIGIVPGLLKACLEIIISRADNVLSEKIVETILERSIDLIQRLYDNDEVDRIFGDVLLRIFLFYPQMVVNLKDNILKIFQLIQNPNRDQCISMIWIIGQYTSTLTNVDIAIFKSYYEAIECLIYEHLVSLNQNIISVSLGAFIKLANSDRDIIPRVKLLLDKLLHHTQTQSNESENWTEVSSRVKQAQVVLSQISSQNQDSFNVESLIKFTTAIVEEDLANG